MPELSVIIPVYNVEKYLERCVNSVRRQTWKDLEIILVDDGSGDRSGEICDAFARKDGRVLAVHQENQGPSSARNAGLDLARGRYVGFVDGDDWVKEDFYEHLLGLARKENADLVTCLYIRTDTEKIFYKKPAFERVKTLEGENMLKYFLASAMKGGVTYVPCWSKIYRRDSIAGCRFRTDVYYSEDMLFNWEALHSVRQCVYSNYKGYFYFQNAGSITAANRSDFLKSIHDLRYVAKEIERIDTAGSRKIRYLIKQYKAKVHFSILMKYSRSDYQDRMLLEELLKRVRREGKYLMASSLSMSRKVILLFVMAAPQKLLLKMMHS